MKTIVALTLMLTASQPSTPDPLPEFVAAVLKPTLYAPAPPRPGPLRVFGFRLVGGPGSDDPGELRCLGCSLDYLIQQAYELSPEALSDPDWTYYEKYDLIAKIPLASSRHQVNLMLRQLLTERFHLVSHSVPRELSGYVLEVGKQPSKLTAASSVGDSAIVPIYEGCRLQIVGRGQSMQQLAEALSLAEGVPIIDRTGLSGNFDFRLAWVASEQLAGCAKKSSPVGNDVFDAVKRQLGLKITTRKVPQNGLVVESALKVPTGN